MRLKFVRDLTPGDSGYGHLRRRRDREWGHDDFQPGAGQIERTAERTDGR